MSPNVFIYFGSRRILRTAVIVFIANTSVNGKWIFLIVFLLHSFFKICNLKQSQMYMYLFNCLQCVSFPQLSHKEQVHENLKIFSSLGHVCLCGWCTNIYICYIHTHTSVYWWRVLLVWAKMLKQFCKTWKPKNMQLFISQKSVSFISVSYRSNSKRMNLNGFSMVYCYF